MYVNLQDDLEKGLLEERVSQRFDLVLFSFFMVQNIKEKCHGENLGFHTWGYNIS